VEDEVNQEDSEEGIGLSSVLRPHQQGTVSTGKVMHI